MSRRGITLSLVATFLLTAGMMWAHRSWAAQCTLQDGTKFKALGNKVFLLDKTGGQVLARDGSYRTSDGKTFQIRGGKFSAQDKSACFPPIGTIPRPLTKNPPETQPAKNGFGIYAQVNDQSEHEQEHTTSPDKETHTIDPSVEYGSRTNIGQRVQPGAEKVKGKILNVQPQQGK